MQRIKSGTHQAKSSIVSGISVQKPTTSTFSHYTNQVEAEDEKQSCWSCCYNKTNNTFFGRTCKSWGLIIIYAIMYLIFLGTFFMMCLFGALLIIKHNEEYFVIDKLQLHEYSDGRIGLTGVPLAEEKGSIIWYQSGEDEEYAKYIKAIDLHLNINDTTRKKRDINNFGPCGSEPYGYGNEPCVFVRINKQRHWSAKPINANSSEAKTVPKEIDKWLKSGRSKLWLHCEGINPWDKDHVGTFKYYPYPPGFDPGLFPLDLSRPSPMVAVQLTNFTLGISLSVHCKVWYAGGVSTLEFLLYVARPK